MKTESHNGTALQDYTRTCGVPHTIKTDNAQSEIGKSWTDHCRTHCIATETTEARSPWQNPCEKRIGCLSSMVRVNMRTFGVPLGNHDWVQKWCCDVHNHVVSRNLNWRTPMEISEGHRIYLSSDHIREPVWYYDITVKQPQDNFKKSRWLGIARTAGEAFTYYIYTEKPAGT